MNNIKHVPYGAPKEKSKWHDSYGVFTQEQDNDKPNVEPVYSYDALPPPGCPRAGICLDIRRLYV